MAIVALDFVMALGAMVLGYEYGNWLGVALVSIITGSFAFKAARESGVRVGVGVGAFIALADATIGWAITWGMGPGAPVFMDAFDYDTLPFYVAATIVSVVAVGALIGLVAGVLAARIRRSDVT